MVAKKQQNKKNPTKIDKVDFHYVKANCYRSYHVDGAYGGLTPKGKIVAHLFNERLAIPQMIKYKVTEDGGLGEEIEREGKTGFIREMECSLIMDVDVAEVLVNWLQEKIDIAKLIDKQSKDKAQ